MVVSFTIKNHNDKKKENINIMGLRTSKYDITSVGQ